jgi:hypothetical protein
MRGTLFAFSSVVLLPAAAQAATCESSFNKSGNPITGLHYTASVALPDLKPASAIGQMRGIAVGKGYDVLAAEAEDGSMLIEQPQTSKARAFPITITATDDNGVGTVQMDAKLRAGMMTSSDAAKTEMCAMLNQIKPGKAGALAASNGMNATGTSAPLALSALSLSHQISKDTERNAPAVPLRYQNKTFVVDGRVKYVTKDGDVFRVGFDVPQPYEEALRLPNEAPFKTDIVCLMAKGQSVYALQLKPDKAIKLSGTYADFSEIKHVLWIKDCRPVK